MRQSEHLVGVLAGQPIGHVFSSPTVRCAQTVTPLAEAHGLEVEERLELSEGRDPAVAWALALDHAGSHPVLCSHGDVIPAILGGLRSQGLRTEDDLRCEKGSTWIIEVGKKGRVESASYHGPGR